MKEKKYIVSVGDDSKVILPSETRTKGAKSVNNRFIRRFKLPSGETVTISEPVGIGYILTEEERNNPRLYHQVLGVSDVHGRFDKNGKMDRVVRLDFESGEKAKNFIDFLLTIKKGD